MLRQFEYKEEDRFVEEGFQRKFLTVLDEFEHHYTGEKMYHVRLEYVTDALHLPVVEYETLTYDEYDTLFVASENDVTKETVSRAKCILEANLRKLNMHIRRAEFPVYVVRDGWHLIVTTESWAEGMPNAEAFFCSSDLADFRNRHEYEVMNNVHS